jgi:hypothetical protein
MANALDLFIFLLSVDLMCFQNVANFVIFLYWGTQVVFK